MSPVPQPEEQRDRPNNEETEIDETDYPDVIINADSSDDDAEDDEDEDDGYMGYQALSMNHDNSESDEEEIEFESSQGNHAEEAESQQTTNIYVPEGVVQQVRLQQSSDGTSALPTYMQVPEPPRPERDDLLWNQPRPSDISLETGKEEKIKSVMSEFKLPTCNIPDWAKGLTEDQWQAQVVNQLKGTSPPTGSNQMNANCWAVFSKTDSSNSDTNRKGSDNKFVPEAESFRGGSTSPD